MLEMGVNELTMPFVIGSLAFPLLLIGIYSLTKTPEPNKDDINLRGKRKPITWKESKSIVSLYRWPLCYMFIIYIVLTVLRDIRDNFAVEIWAELGQYSSFIYTTAELPIAFLVLIFLGILYLIKDNHLALLINARIMLGGALIMILSTILFLVNNYSPIIWMVVTGLGIFLPYILLNGILF